METYAQLSSNLLIEAANFLIKLSDQNDETKPQMEENAAVFRQVAGLIKDDPNGSVENLTHTEMASRLLTDAATFFRSIAEQNPPIAEQMNNNAEVYEELSTLVRETPNDSPPEE